jgi:peptidyl-prolyl cis-trans isomerase SurA
MRASKLVGRRLSVAALSHVVSLLWLASQTAGIARADVIERVVAVVNEDAIFLSELRRRAAPFLEQVAQVGDEATRKERIKRLYQQFLDQLVDEELIEQTSRKMSVTVSSLEVDQAIENVRTQNSLSLEQFWEAVKTQGFTEKQYREDVRKQLLRLKVTNQRVRSRVDINEDTVREEYDERVRSARRRQRFHAAHVFLPVDAAASATDAAETLKRAQKLREGLSAATFDETMNRTGGGDLGWLDQGDLPEDLELALLAMEPGEISEPVRGPSGVHVFLLRERQAGSTQVPSFAEAKDAIYRELLDKAMLRQQEIFLAELRRSAVIELRP